MIPIPSEHRSTWAVHGGQRTDDNRNLPAPPLVTNSAVLLESVEQGWEQLTNESVDNYAYQRYANPTVRVLEHKFAQLEGSAYALAFNSGMTACFVLFRALLVSGDHVVAQHSLYHEISDQLVADRLGCGVDTTFVENYSVAGFTSAFTDRTRMVFVESPTNPALYGVDVPRLAATCRDRGVLLVVDNTLLTHEHQRPLALGAHLALYSTTKTINGHGDAMGGLITTDDVELHDRLKSFRDNTGTIMSPFGAWLTVRGMRTLPLRLERQGRNADQLAAYLQARNPETGVQRPTDSRYASENKITGNAGILVFTLPSRDIATEFIRGLRLLRIGTTFGNLESLVYHFGTFARPSRDITRIGLDYGLIRISVGIEDLEDIIDDIDQALNAAGVARAAA